MRDAYIVVQTQSFMLWMERKNSVVEEDTPWSELQKVRSTRPPKLQHHYETNAHTLLHCSAAPTTSSIHV